MRHHDFPGYLIAIEGIDGAGKTTQAHFVQDALQARKLTVIRTKEPTTGTYGQILRDSALTGRLSLEEEVEHFINDRREHVASIIAPALKEGFTVIIDRYYFSSMAYQGARGMEPEEIMRRNEEFAPEPDLLVHIDVEPAVGLQRIKMRGSRKTHFETTDTLTKARAIFKSIDKPYLFEVDGAKEPEEIRNLILRQFAIIATNRIAGSNAAVEQKLNATLALFGGDPITGR